MAASSRLIGEIEINQANLDHNHFYMAPLLHKFPSELIGGSNRSKAAKRDALIDWGGSDPVRTDIDGTKKFFRARGWIGAFNRLNSARPGDRVRVEELAPYSYRVTLVK